MPQNQHESQLTREEKIELARAEIKLMRQRIGELEGQFMECNRRYARAQRILRQEGAEQ